MKVLIVDDEAPARARLLAMLESIDGYSSCGDAANGAEALALAEQAEPDILLMDIRMPGMDGLEAAQHLQSLEQPPAIIFTTAYNDYALQAFDTHAVDYLLKPVRQERLMEALATRVRIRRKGKGDGRLEITFHDEEELQRIFEHIVGAGAAIDVSRRLE